MDVNGISNNISNLNQPSQLQVDKSLETKQVEKVDSESASSLSINEYNKKRDELSLNVQSLNNGIAISDIATEALQKEQNFLQNIQDQLQDLKSTENKLEDKNNIKQAVNDNLKSFNQVAYETSYKNENLLSLDYYDENKEITINTDSQTFSIEKINTPDFANQIFELVNNSDLNDPTQLDAAISKVETSSTQIQNISDKFTEFGNIVEENARETIKDQVDLFNENDDKNFGKDSLDFSKNNIFSNVGYLAASQANIVQAQSVRLLS